ncbi:MAG: insulinase family protein, partial [Thermoguttaceae bacterium]|nr:insulinase family protein [Thermoguttaceae bacterium]
EKMTIDDLHRFHQTVYRPNGTVIGVAGRVPWEKLRDKIGQLFGDWRAKDAQRAQLEENGQSTVHIPSNNAQATIKLGYRDVSLRTPDYLRSLGGVKVLSGGMSSRLFTEVREKRGLCYTVNASHYSIEDLGYVVCSCGTTVERAQESLDVILTEIERLGTEPISNSELERVKIRLKSSLIMQRESTSRRVGAMIGDWLDFQKIQQLGELSGKIESLTCEAIEAYYAENTKSRKFRLATLGAQPLDISKERLF